MVRGKSIPHTITECPSVRSFLPTSPFVIFEVVEINKNILKNINHGSKKIISNVKAVALSINSECLFAQRLQQKYTWPSLNPKVLCGMMLYDFDGG